MCLRRIFFFLLCYVFFISTLSAQKPPAKFGKIDKDLLASKVCPIDSSAHAYFVFDFGSSYFKYAETTIAVGEEAGDNKGFQLYFTRHFRIKIIDKEGFDWANIEIPLYKDEEEEMITSIRARTYNLEAGKVKEIKLNRKEIIREETSENWMTRKFGMPGVKEGSVIDVEYTIRSDFYFNLREWNFQHLIPALHSEYHVKIPEYFFYNQTQIGYLPISVEHQTRGNSISFKYREDGRTVGNNTISFRDDLYDFYAQNIPAFPIEPYLKSAKNYLSAIEFELSHTKFPQSSITYYTKDWAEISQRLMNSSFLGKRLEKTGHLDPYAKLLNEQFKQDTLGLIDGALSMIKSQMAWNGLRTKYADTPLNRSFNNNEGNAADINLNLVALLRSLGLNSYPVVLSTKDNGILHPAHATISGLNYLIAAVIFQEGIILLDATSSISEMNLIPTRCLNDKGLLLAENNMSWVQLMNIKSAVNVEKYEYIIDKDLNLTGSASIKFKDYAAYNLRSEISSDAKEQEKYFKNDELIQMDSFQIKGLEDLYNTIEATYKFTKAESVDESDDLVFFVPVLNPFFKENPFRLKDRKFPVEFDHPYKITHFHSISIPEGYEIAEKPEDLVLRLENRGLTYSYRTSILGDKLNVITILAIKKTLFLPDEYSQLNTVLDMIIEKEGEFIVLKKSE